MLAALASLALATPVELPVSGRMLDTTGSPLNEATAVTALLCDTAVPDPAESCVAASLGTLPMQNGYFHAWMTIDHSVLNITRYLSYEVAGQELLPRVALGAVPAAVNVVGGSVSASDITATGAIRLGSGTLGDSCAGEGGAMLYDAAESIALLCDGTSYQALGVPGIGLQFTNGGYEWADGTHPARCLAYLEPATGYVYDNEGSAIYWVDPDGSGALPPRRTYCDMTEDGGGWTLAVNIHSELNPIDLYTYDHPIANPVGANYGIALDDFGVTTATEYRLSCTEASNNQEVDFFLRGVDPAQPAFRAAGTVNLSGVECSQSHTFSSPQTGGNCMSFDDGTHTYWGRSDWDVKWALFSQSAAYTLRHCQDRGAGYFNQGGLWFR